MRDRSAAAQVPGRSLTRRLRIAASLLSLLALGPALLLSAHGRLRLPAAAVDLGFRAHEVRLWLPMGALLVFVLGWALAGAAVRPRHSRLLGVQWSAALYVLVGMMYWTAVAVRIGYHPTVPWTTVASDPFILVRLCLWPVHAADAAGLFGFRLG